MVTLCCGVSIYICFIDFPLAPVHLRLARVQLSLSLCRFPHDHLRLPEVAVTEANGRARDYTVLSPLANGGYVE